MAARINGSTEPSWRAVGKTSPVSTNHRDSRRRAYLQAGSNLGDHNAAQDLVGSNSFFCLQTIPAPLAMMVVEMPGSRRGQQGVHGAPLRLKADRADLGLILEDAARRCRAALTLEELYGGKLNSNPRREHRKIAAESSARSAIDTCDLNLKGPRVCGGMIAKPATVFGIPFWCYAVSATATKASRRGPG